MPVPMVTENHLAQCQQCTQPQLLTHDGLKFRITLRQPTLYLDGLCSICAASGWETERCMSPARMVLVEVVMF